MREIDVGKITEAIKKLCLETNLYLPRDVEDALRESSAREESPTGKEILRQILENIKISRAEKIPLCQDTGYTVVFLEIGQEVRLTGGDLASAINAGVSQGYKEGYLRKSIVEDPLRRKNTGDNTPAIIHTEIVPGEKVKLTVLPKGGGSENMSEARVLAPAAGWEGIEDFVVERVRKSGANPCPPVIVGVGIGGTFEYCTYLAKKALLRKIGSRHPDPYYQELEERLLKKINNLGIGPLGLGGRITALAVHIEVFPAHIASLPVAVNIQCHAARHKEIVL